MKRDLSQLAVKVWAWAVLVMGASAFAAMVLSVDSNPIANKLMVAALVALFGPMVLLTLYYAWKEWKGRP